jgi:hypothetical protein
MQLCPQLPQLAGSVARLTHDEEQFVNPDAHPQTPDLHAVFVPGHDVPSWALPWSTQTEAPVEQDVIPVWHAFAAGVQATFAVQETHWPLEQTWFVPQEVPLLAVEPVSLQTT